MVQSHTNDCLDKSDFVFQGHCTDFPCVLVDDAFSVESLTGFGANAMRMSNTGPANKSPYGNLWLTLPNPAFWNTNEDLEIIVAVYPKGASRAPASNNDNMHGLRVRDASRRTATLLWANYDIWKPTYGTHTGMFVLTTETGLAADPSKGPDERTAWDTPIISTGRANLAKTPIDLLSGTTGWAWMKITIKSGVVSAFYHRSNSWSLTPPTSAYEWEIGSYTYGSLGNITEIGIMGLNEFNQGGFTYFRNLQITTTLSGPVGLDPTIKFSSYVLRTALNAGGKATLTTENPFYNHVSAFTLLTQLKKLVTYVNAFESYQWIGESQAVSMSTHQATYECEEMLIKTKFTEVGVSPIIISYFIRFADGLIIYDKDGSFVSNGVTNNHLVVFAKADKKIFENRPAVGSVTTTTDDFTTPFVADLEAGSDEFLYFNDKELADSDNGLISVHSTYSGGNPKFVLHLPVNIQEKFINLGKLNKLEIRVTLSTVSRNNWTTLAGGDATKYRYWLYNYYTSAWELIETTTKTETEGSSITAESGDKRTAAFTVIWDVNTELKEGVAIYASATTYSLDDEKVFGDKLYRSLENNNQGNQPDVSPTKWILKIYDFCNYESTASASEQFSKINTVGAIQMPNIERSDKPTGIWLWEYSHITTFDNDNEPEISSCGITSVTETTITLTTVGGINLPLEDGFSVGDVISIVKAADDYLQDAWDASDLVTNLGALNINITGIGTLGLAEDYTYRPFFELMQDICKNTNSTFWADYGITSTVEIESADNHTKLEGVVLTRDDIYNYNSGGWSIDYDASIGKNNLRILGDNVNYLKPISPAFDPFDLGDEILIISDSSVQTLLQAATLATKMKPRLEGYDILVSLDLNFTNPFQNYSAIEVGKIITLQLPTSASATIFDDDLLIIAIDLNRNETTGDQEIATLTLQFRWS